MNEITRETPFSAIPVQLDVLPWAPHTANRNESVLSSDSDRLAKPNKWFDWTK